MHHLISVAGVLSLLFVLAHIFGGGKDVHAPLLESALSDELKGYVSIVWHAITASMLVCAVLFLVAARDASLRTPFTLVAVAQFSSFGALFLFYGVVRLGSVWVMPQWIGFAVIVLVALLGLWAQQRVSVPS